MSTPNEYVASNFSVESFLFSNASTLVTFKFLFWLSSIVFLLFAASVTADTYFFNARSYAVSCNVNFSKSSSSSCLFSSKFVKSLSEFESISFFTTVSFSSLYSVIAAMFIKELLAFASSNTIHAT